MQVNNTLKTMITIVMLVLALAGGATTAAADDDVLNIAVPTDPDSFDPTRSVAAATAEIAFNIYEGLVKSTPEGKVAGALASHRRLIPARQCIRFTLEAYFHDGSRRGGRCGQRLNRARILRSAKGLGITKLLPLCTAWETTGWSLN